MAASGEEAEEGEAEEGEAEEEEAQRPPAARAGHGMLAAAEAVGRALLGVLPCRSPRQKQTVPPALPVAEAAEEEGGSAEEETEAEAEEETGAPPAPATARAQPARAAPRTPTAALAGVKAPATKTKGQKVGWGGSLLRLRACWLGGGRQARRVQHASAVAPLQRPPPAPRLPDPCPPCPCPPPRHSAETWQQGQGHPRGGVQALHPPRKRGGGGAMTGKRGLLLLRGAHTEGRGGSCRVGGAGRGAPSDVCCTVVLSDWGHP